VTQEKKQILGGNGRKKGKGKNNYKCRSRSFADGEG